VRRTIRTIRTTRRLRRPAPARSGLRRAAFALCAAAALAVALPAPGAAHESGLYVSLKLGTTDVDAEFGDAFDKIIDGDDDSKTIEAGFRLGRYWAIQGGYHDFGEAPGFGTPCRDDVEVCIPVDVPLAAETTAYSLALVPQLPLGQRLSVFAKIGAIALESEVRDADGTRDFFEDFSEEDVLWGAGLRLQIIGPIQLFYEYEGVGEEFETQSFGATWQF
jgi:hypothetical protein